MQPSEHEALHRGIDPVARVADHPVDEGCPGAGKADCACLKGRAAMSDDYVSVTRTAAKLTQGARVATARAKDLDLERLLGPCSNERNDL